ncbi:MAG: class I SAM-dependent methyltransferase [Kofleriaceae bacterium]
MRPTEECDEEPTPIWGSEAIDPNGRNLPALKAKFLLEHLPDAGDVLEVGSGDGKILRTLVNELPGLRVHGCDIRPWERPAPGVEFRAMTRDIPYASQSFDAILVVDVLEHVDDPPYLISEIARALRPGGRFVGFVPIEGERASLYSLYRGLLGADLYARTKHHVQSFTHADVQELLRERFELVDVNHAYHLLGHAMDATFFAAAQLPRLSKFWWRENRYYAKEKTSDSPLASVLNRMLELGNLLAYVESRLLARHRLASAGLLFEARLKSC